MAIRKGRQLHLKRHRATGMAYVYLEGRQRSFGPFDDPETHKRFASFLAQLQASGGVLPEDPQERPAFTVADVAALYLQHAETYYRDPQTDEPTDELKQIGYAFRPMLDLYAALPVGAFGLRCLKAVRERMLESGRLSRKTINIRIGRIRRCFRWGASGPEVVPPSVVHELATLEPLQPGRCTARESEPVAAVPWEHVERVLEHVTPPIRAMLLLQWFTGMRPGEVRRFRTEHLDRQGDVWMYQPPTHKTAHRGKARFIPIGPRAQVVLGPFLNRVPLPDPSKPVFSPKDGMASRRNGRRSKRSLPKRDASGRWLKGSTEKAGPIQQPGEMYTKDSYPRAVTRGCIEAGVPQFSPNQLRHSAATRIRSELGLDAAQAVLGHSKSDTTEIYAEVTREKAMEVAATLG